MSSLPIVAIIGRPNVGKSTLFNRLIRRRHAIVDNTPGITRDRLYGQCSWGGKEFMLVDTGGLIVGAKQAKGSSSSLEAKVAEQATIAIEQADTVVFLLDARVGVQNGDIAIAKNLKRCGKSVIVACNKVDAERDEASASEFYSLGFDQLVCVSAANGRNTAELLDLITERLPPAGGTSADDVQETHDIKVAIVGRPNVGKSSLLNSMMGKKVSIVSELPGTTRDAIDTRLEVEGQRYLLIDTAGLKKKNIYKSQIEYYTTLRTIRAIARCDIAVVVVDAVDGLVAGDLRIATQASELFKGLIFAVNKWDVVAERGQSDDRQRTDEWRLAIYRRAPLFSFVPVLFISALTGQRIQKVWEAIMSVSQERKKRIRTPDLNRLLKDITERRPPPAREGKFIRFYYATQAECSPPTFVIFCNYPKLVEKPYLRYLENQFRKTFGFRGCPLRITLRRRS